jgi:hypothetical protein
VEEAGITAYQARAVSVAYVPVLHPVTRFVQIRAVPGEVPVQILWKIPVIAAGAGMNVRQEISAVVGPVRTRTRIQIIVAAAGMSALKIMPAAAARVKPFLLTGRIAGGVGMPARQENVAVQ